MCGGEGVSSYIACVWARMFIVPRSAVERWWVGIMWMIQDVNGTFFMFVLEFCDEGKVPSPVK